MDERTPEIKFTVKLLPSENEEDRTARGLEELQSALNELARVMEKNQSQRQRQEPELMFPFSLMERLIMWGFGTLERIMSRLVKRIIR
jgi:hypothetical protein